MVGPSLTDQATAGAPGVGPVTTGSFNTNVHDLIVVSIITNSNLAFIITAVDVTDTAPGGGNTYTVSGGYTSVNDASVVIYYATAISKATGSIAVTVNVTETGGPLADMGVTVGSYSGLTTPVTEGTPASSGSPGPLSSSVNASAGDTLIAIAAESNNVGAVTFNPNTYTDLTSTSGTSSYLADQWYLFSSASAGVNTGAITSANGGGQLVIVLLDVTNGVPPVQVTDTADTTSGNLPLAVNFTSNPVGGTAPYTFAWAFGDGGTSTDQNPSHTYTTQGTYTVTLMVTDSALGTATATPIIIVALPAAPVSGAYITSVVFGVDNTGTNVLPALDVVAGQSVYVCIGYNTNGGSPPSSVMDSQGNSYTEPSGDNQPANDGGPAIGNDVWYFDNITASGPLVITITASALGIATLAAAYAISNTGGPPSLDNCAFGNVNPGTGAVAPISADLPIAGPDEVALVFTVAGDSAPPVSQTLVTPIITVIEVTTTDADGDYDCIFGFDPSPIPGTFAYNGTTNESAGAGSAQMMGTSILGIIPPPPPPSTTNTNPLSYFGYSPETMFGFRQEPFEG